jgi:hypothetical protein
MINTEQRLLDGVAFNREGRCWEWQRSVNNSGYGHFRHLGRKTYAHRVAYLLFCGPIPDGLCVCHRCDNPKCCNPTHLFLGTHADNHADKVRKGRHQYGERRYNAKLSATQVASMRRLYARGAFGVRRLAQLFGVCRKTVFDIIGEDRWKF